MRLRRWALGVPLSLAALVPLVPAHPATAAFPGANGLLAADSIGTDCKPLDASGRLVTMRADGSRVRALVNCEGRPRVDGASAPDWSPDGRRLLIESRLGVVLMNADGSRRRIVAAGGAPSFAPTAGGSRFVQGSEIWRGSIDGDGRRRLVRGHTPRWSPDGRTIAYLSGGDVRLVAARTGRRIRSLGPGAGAIDWSPDSRNLVFGHGYDVRIVSADGHRRRRLPWPHGLVGDVVFSPDGRRIALASQEVRGDDARISIWTASLRGKDKRRIYRGAWADSEGLTGTPQLSWGPRPR